MKNKFGMLFATALFLTLPLAAQQQPAPSSQKPDSETQGLTSPAASGTLVVGTLSKMDANTLAIKQADGKEQSFKLDSSATITIDGKAASVSQLKAGQKVSVSTEGDKAIAVSATSVGSSS
jgi:hypothetical protein